MTKHFKILLCAILLSLTFAAHSAYAQSFTQDGADTIKTELQNWLNRQIDLMSLGQAGAPLISSDGALTVTPENGYYAAKFPFISYDVEGLGRFEIGQIAANIIPGADNTWRITVSFPKTMDIFDKNGSPIAQISLGKQKFGGLWDVTRNTYIKYQGAYENITVKDIGEEFGTFRIGNVNILQNFNPIAPGSDRYNGPFNFSINDTEIQLKGPYKTQISVNRIVSENHYEDIKLIDSKTFETELNAFTKNPENGFDNYFKAMIGLFDAMPNKSTGHVTFEGITIKGQDVLGDTGFNAQSITLTANSDQFKSDQAEFDMEYALNGLSIHGLPETYAPFVPSDAKFDIKMSNLPLQSLLNLMETSLTQAFDNENTQTPEQRRQMLQLTFLSLPKLLSDHGTQLSINDTRIIMPALQTALQGKIQADANAAKQAIGQFTLSITDLANTISILQQAASQPSALPQIQQALFGLRLAQGFGQLEADGQTYKYDFELNAEGQMLLNGQPLGGILGSQGH